MLRCHEMSFARSLALSLLILSPSILSAQSLGKIEGRVADAQQGALPQATVEILNVTPARRAVTDAAGRFDFTGLAYGPYRLKAVRAGFESAEQNIEVRGPETQVEILLKLAPVAESITVLADNERLVASRTEIPLRELPVTVQTVTSDVLQQTGATDLVRALYNVPGTNSVLLYGVYEYYIFRGFGFDNIVGSSVLLDGLRQEGNRINSQLNFIESVEVLKGPSSMLYGTEAVGGTVNLVRKKPVSTPNYEFVARGGRWGYGGAEFGATGPLSRSQNLLYRIDLGFNRADGWRDAGWRRFNVSPAIHWRATSRDQLNFYSILTFDNYDGDAGFPLLRAANEANPYRATTIPNVPFSTRFSTPSDFQRTRDAIPQMFWTHTFSDDIRLRNAFSYRIFNDQYFVAETLSHTPAVNPNLINREMFYFFHHRRPLLNQTDVVATVRKKIEHQLVAGYEFANYDSTTFRSSSVFGIPVAPVDLRNPQVGPLLPPTNFPISRKDHFDNRTHAVYFQDFLRFNPRVTALFSGRYDNFQRDARRNPVSNGTETIAPLTQISQTPFTYRAALNVQAMPWMGLYGSYGTSFRAQTSLSDDGKNLKPETGRQFEFGQRFDLLRNRATLNTALFWIEKENVTVSRPNGIFDQAGRLRSKGFEAELRGRPTARLQLLSSYGFTQAQFKDFFAEDGDGVVRDLRGRTPTFVPRHTARLWAAYDLPRGFQVALGTRYLGKNPPSNFNYYFLGGYTIWDAAVFYRTRKFEWGLNLNNFTNKERYFLGAINEVLLYPGRPFDAQVNLRYRF